MLLCDFCCSHYSIIGCKGTIELKLMTVNRQNSTDYEDFTSYIKKIKSYSYRNHNVYIISKKSLKGWIFSKFSTQEIHEALLFHHSLSARLSSRSVEQLFCPTLRATICFSRAWHPLAITKCGNGQLMEDACIWN